MADPLELIGDLTSALSDDNPSDPYQYIVRWALQEGCKANGWADEKPDWFAEHGSPLVDLAYTSFSHLPKVGGSDPDYPWELAQGICPSIMKGFKGPSVAMGSFLKGGNVTQQRPKGTTAAATRMSDGAAQPARLSDAPNFFPADLPPHGNIREVLLGLEGSDPAEMQELIDCFDQDKVGRGWTDEALAKREGDVAPLTEDDILAIYSYSFENKDQGSARRRVTTVQGEDLMAALTEYCKDFVDDKPENGPKEETLAMLSTLSSDDLVLLIDEEADSIATRLSLEGLEAERMRNLMDFIKSPEADTSRRFQIYSYVNRSMRESVKDPSKSAPYLPFIKLLTAALNKLPPRASVVFRGIGMEIEEAFYRPSSNILWAGFSSTSEDASVAKDFIGGKSMGVLFLINATDGRSIAEFSRIPSEKELLLPSNSALRVKGIAGKGTRAILEVPDGIRVLEMEQLTPECAAYEDLVEDARDGILKASQDTECAKRLEAEFPESAGCSFSAGLQAAYIDYDYETALSHLARAIDVESENVAFLKEYAYCLSKLGMFLAADFAYKRALKIDPLNEMLQYSYAWSLGERGDFRGLSRVLGIVCDALGRYYVKMTREDGEASSGGWLLLAVAANPGNKWAVETYVAHLQNKGEHELAQALLDDPQSATQTQDPFTRNLYCTWFVKAWVEYGLPE